MEGESKLQVITCIFHYFDHSYYIICIFWARDSLLVEFFWWRFKSIHFAPYVLILSWPDSADGQELQESDLAAMLVEGFIFYKEVFSDNIAACVIVSWILVSWGLIRLSANHGQ